MKKKIIIIGMILILLIGLVIYFVINSEVEEYVPEEEISKEDSNMATVTLFFQNKETKQLEAENRNINTNQMYIIV